MNDQQIAAEEHYQQGLNAFRSTQGERRENVRRAIACYEMALQYSTSEASPERWQRIQQSLAETYGELVQERLTQTLTDPEPSRPARRPRLTWRQGLLLALATMVVLAIPTTVLALASLARGASCVKGTLTLAGSTVLQPLVMAAAEDYMQHCPGALITVGGGASKTGLADVEQGHAIVDGVNPQEDPGHLAGRDVPVEIGDSDIFASPVQRDLVDHQIAIGIFVMILNQNVTGLHNLSTAQIQGIYTGVYQNWRQICSAGQCGPNLPITPISRTVNSGERATFEAYVLRGVATIPGIGLDQTQAASDAVQEVENTPGSIGYAPLYQANQAHDVIILSIDSQNPRNVSLIERDAYTFWNIEHMYTKGPGSPLAQSFLSFLASDVVTHLLAHFAFLPLTAIAQRIRDAHVHEEQ